MHGTSWWTACACAQLATKSFQVLRCIDTWGTIISLHVFENQGLNLPHFRSQLWRVNGWALAHMPQPCAHSWQHHCTVWANPSSLHIIPKVALVRAHHCMYKSHFTHRIPSSSIKVCSKRGLRPWPGVRISMSCLGSLDVTTMRILSMVICCVLQWRNCCGPHWCIDEQIPGQLWEKPINISIVFMTTG